MDMELIERILDLPESQLNALFKPKQQQVLRKARSGDELDNNEKRYLRGGIRAKVEMIESLIGGESTSPLQAFTIGLENYYISGYEALKHNGYGWYFNTKRILIYNTRMEGKFHIPGKLIIAKRVRSLRKRSYERDRKTGIIYADNGQILEDALSEGDDALVRECMSHIRRYGEMFINEHMRFLDAERTPNIDPVDFGV